MKLLMGVAVQTAFIAIASRLVGATFRVLETLNPSLQERRVISDPKAVFQREAITIGMAWVFALATSLAILPFARGRGWNPYLTTFLTAVAGTSIAESVARIIAYQPKSNVPKAALWQSTTPPKKQEPMPRMPLPTWSPGRQSDQSPINESLSMGFYPGYLAFPAPQWRGWPQGYY